MALFKRKITEDKIVEEFLHWTMKAVQDSWLSFYDNFQSVTKSLARGKIEVKDQDIASYFLYCSIVASNIVFIKNNYSAEQASRLISKIKINFSPDQSREALNILNEFIKDFSEKTTNHSSPIDSATARLLRLWLDDNNFEKICDGEYVSPFLITLTRDITLHYYGGWSRIKTNYKIVVDK